MEHLGIVKNGVEDTESLEVEQWKGALENYTLTSTGENTELFVETDIAEEYLDEFQKIWPKALKKVKELAEKVS